MGFNISFSSLNPIETNPGRQPWFILDDKPYQAIKNCGW